MIWLNKGGGGGGNRPKKPPTTHMQNPRNWGEMTKSHIVAKFLFLLLPDKSLKVLFGFPYIM